MWENCSSKRWASLEGRICGAVKTRHKTDSGKATTGSRVFPMDVSGICKDDREMRTPRGIKFRNKPSVLLGCAESYALGHAGSQGETGLTRTQ
jgi:hypothetical protein